MLEPSGLIGFIDSEIIKVKLSDIYMLGATSRMYCKAETSYIFNFITIF